MEPHDALQLNALQLAYLGDSVWEIIVRFGLLVRKYNVRHMHKSCVSLVNAHAQSELLRVIQDRLDGTEAEIVRRGRNAHPKHSAPKNQNPEEYAAATGFEALFGFLYLTGQELRIRDLCEIMSEVIKDA